MSLPAHTSSITSLARRFDVVALVRCSFAWSRRRRARPTTGRNGADPRRDGRSAETGLPAKWSPPAAGPAAGENLAWRVPIGSRSSPVVFGNRVYLYARPAPRSCGRSGWSRSTRRAARRSGRSISASISPTSRRTAWRGRRRSVDPGNRAHLHVRRQRRAAGVLTRRQDALGAWPGRGLRRHHDPRRPVAVARRRRRPRRRQHADLGAGASSPAAATGTSPSTRRPATRCGSAHRRNGTGTPTTPRRSWRRSTARGC